MSPVGPAIKPPICLVCFEKAKNRKFGVASCTNCANFFELTVRQGNKLSCEKRGHCLINKETRVTCQSCFLQRCLWVGMKREKVPPQKLCLPSSKSNPSDHPMSKGQQGSFTADEKTDELGDGKPKMSLSSCTSNGQNGNVAVDKKKKKELGKGKKKFSHRSSKQFSNEHRGNVTADEQKKKKKKKQKREGPKELTMAEKQQKAVEIVESCRIRGVDMVIFEKVYRECLLLYSSIQPTEEENDKLFRAGPANGNSSVFFMIVDHLVETFKKLVDHNADPCDNFYRHVCPLSNSTKIMELMKTPFLPKSTGILNELEIINIGYTEPFAAIEKIANDFEELCSQGINTTTYFTQFDDLFLSNGERLPLSHLRGYKDCKRAAELIKRVLVQVNSSGTRDAFNMFGKQLETIRQHLTNVQAVSSILDYNLEEGVEQTNEFVDGIKKIAKKWIMETPWTHNNNVTEVVLNALLSTSLVDTYAKSFRKSMDLLIKAEFDYRKCKQQYHDSTAANFFCVLASLKTHFTESVPLEFGLPMNAFNDFPNIIFNVPFYYLAKNSEEMAAKLGSTGIVVGHEISHTLIKSRDDFVLPYFSEMATECFQNQFNSTCNEFKEVSCVVEDKQIDENGSDILGTQLAYTLLEEHYGERLYDIYAELNVTYQQLFFYSFGIIFCSQTPLATQLKNDGSTDEHSLFNVRINSFAQHPGFKEAFKCSDDSRMMRSATEQCHIYGAEAPQNKRL
ncbi:unnamed protein product [Caenorhabditis sp. 36 PRJEB53466]|nr:unnamed protein product [Caenorhabditis sp. 36 PRJEB53466]